MNLRYLVWNDKNVPASIVKFAPFVDDDAEELKSMYRNFNLNANGVPLDGINMSGTIYQIAESYTSKVKRSVAVGRTKTKYRVEMSTASGDLNQLAIVDFKDIAKGSVAIKAGSTDDGKAIADGYSDMFTGTAIVVALCAYANATYQEARERFTKLTTAIESEDTDINIGRALAAYSDTIYSLFIANGNYLGLNLPKSGIKAPSQKEMKEQSDEMLFGNFKFFAEAKPLEIKQLDTSDLSLNAEAELSDDDKKLIPSKPNHEISPVAVEFATMVKMTAKYDTAIKTAYLVGPAGTGKTVICSDTAYLLGLPYSYKTCDADMDIGDLLYGQVYVNTGNGQNKVSFDDVRKEMGLPSIDEITLDPEGAYVSIFRDDMPDNVTEKEIMVAMIEKVSEELSERLKGKDFIYVEGGLVKTARRGGVFEVQEIGIVKRPGVAVGLNAIMESKKNVFITLPNGEVVKKHKNCIIMFTSNDEYDGTANLNQSVLDRLSHVVYFKNPSTTTMAQRVKDAVTDWFLGDALLDEMAGKIDEISKFCREKDISDGVCGQRSLNNWAMEIMVNCMVNGITTLEQFESNTTLRNNIMRQTCQNTVLNKVSQIAEDIEDVAAGCIDGSYGFLPVRI